MSLAERILVLSSGLMSYLLFSFYCAALTAAMTAGATKAEFR